MPLAIPLVAGPTILATLMLLSHQYPNQMGHLVIALLLAWGGTFVILLPLLRYFYVCWARKG